MWCLTLALSSGLFDVQLFLSPHVPGNCFHVKLQQLLCHIALLQWVNSLGFFHN